MRVSLLLFFRTGHFGEISLNQSRNQIEQQLGLPALWGPQGSSHQADIWRYGSLDLSTDGFVETMTLSETQQYLTDHRISYQTRLWASLQRTDLILDSQVTLSFYPEKKDPTPRFNALWMGSPDSE